MNDIVKRERKKEKETCNGVKLEKEAHLSVIAFLS